MGPSCVTWFEVVVVWPLVMAIGVVVCFRLRVFSAVGIPGRVVWCMASCTFFIRYD